MEIFILRIALILLNGILFRNVEATCPIIAFINITGIEDFILTMSYRSGFGSPKPVEMGKEYEVEISEISRRGDGIARIQGFVIFVEGAKSGQKTNIRITSVGDRFAKAQIV
jgi:predicted RNA-binding protein with TRAM domain